MHDENYFNLNEFMDRFDIKKNLCMFKLPKNGGESIITSQSRLMPERLQSPIFIAAQVLYPLCLKGNVQNNHFNFQLFSLFGQGKLVKLCQCRVNNCK